MHVLRGRWRQQLTESGHAYRELLWYQNSDANDIPTRQPLVQEIDWMFASVARSGQLEILREADRQRGQRDPRRCGLARQVAEAWRQADAVLQRRAQDAAREASGPDCASASEIPGR